MAAKADSGGGGSRLGLLVFVGLVVLGLLSGAGFYRWSSKDVETPPRDVAGPESTPAERLGAWLALPGAQQIHQRLVQARHSSEHPWIVSHLVDDRPGEPPEAWGIPVREVYPSASRIDDTQVVLELPAPRALGRAELAGDRARGLPRLDARPPAGHASELLAERVHDLCSDLMSEPRKLVPDVALEVRIRDPEEPPNG